MRDDHGSDREVGERGDEGGLGVRADRPHACASGPPGRQGIRWLEEARPSARRWLEMGGDGGGWVGTSEMVEMAEMVGDPRV